MGNQLLSKAGGAKIYKLKYGHRSHNQPVRMVGTKQLFHYLSRTTVMRWTTTHLGADWEPLFINMNDGSNEGIRHKTQSLVLRTVSSEAASGPRIRSSFR